MSPHRALLALVGMLLIFAAGCTVHPQGENDERHSAVAFEKPFEKHASERVIPPLPDNPSTDDFVHHALLSNAELEQKYWDWRSAIEQIPQDGTQATNLVLFSNVGISRGSTRLNQATLGAGNDPMADIVLPSKLSVASRRALENARASGLRFRKAQFDLRNKVLSAYYDYALTAELVRLSQSNAALLKTTAMVTEARNSAGAAAQLDVLKTRNELDIANNDITNMQAQLPAQQAALNALLDRKPDAPLPVPTELPTKRSMELNDTELLSLAAEKNPELAALSRDLNSKQESIAAAKLQYLPDISVSPDYSRLAAMRGELCIGSGRPQLSSFFSR
jgi:hypothetical protein